MGRVGVEEDQQQQQQQNKKNKNKNKTTKQLRQPLTEQKGNL
jgi:hypothetical protein